MKKGQNEAAVVCQNHFGSAFNVNRCAMTGPQLSPLGPILDPSVRRKHQRLPSSLLIEKASVRGSGLRRAAYVGIVLSLALIGCATLPPDSAGGVVRSRSDVIGIYELTAGAQKITLEVSPDENFIEMILFAAGQEERRTGTWRWKSGRLSFDGLWIPKPFAPEYIRREDAESNTEQPKYTEPAYWSIFPERHWGAITLPIFPDVSFKMVKSAHR